MDDQRTTIIIFGASGDLARTKLVPALFSLRKKGRLGEHVRVVGSARRPYSADAFRELMKGENPSPAWDDFAEGLHYIRADVTSVDSLSKLDESLGELESGVANRIYYFALAPSLYKSAIQNLGAAGLAAKVAGYRRVVIEKPFGHDRMSAHALNECVHAVFDERQVYRIDHFLGKETAQNILFLRFANTVFEPVWNRNYVDHVQISVTETVDVADRGAFYDENGVLRDMFQNHLLQLMSLVAMEPPASFDADAIRNEKCKLLSSVRPIGGEEPMADVTVRGQYEGYQDTEGGIAHDPALRSARRDNVHTVTAQVQIR